MKLKVFAGLVLAVFFTVGLMAEGDCYWRMGPSFTPVAPRPGDVVTIRGTVSLNHGTMTSILLRGGVDGSRLYNHRIPALGVGDMVDVSFTWTADGGEHILWFEIDPTHEQDDTNRDGDRWEQVIRPRRYAQPNLRFASSSFSVVPTSFLAGESVTFHYCVMNNGDGDATETFDVGLRVGGVIVQRHTYAGMVVSAPRCNDFVWTAVCGTDVALVADCDNTVEEVNETDNVFSDDRLQCDSTWHESKNFWLENIRPNTSATPLILSSSPTTISADLHYEGTTGSSTYRTKVIMGIVGSGILRTETFTGLTLPGDAVTTVSFDTVLPSGTTRIFFELDPDRWIAEINESDNREERDIRVIAGSKSRVPGPTKPPPMIKKPLDYKIEIKNKTNLSLRTIKLGSEVRILGNLRIKGSPKTGSVQIKAVFSQMKILGRPLTKTLKLAVSPNSTKPFEFRQRFKAKGVWKVTVEVLVRDGNPGNNKDTAKFTVK